MSDSSKFQPTVEELEEVINLRNSYDELLGNESSTDDLTFLPFEGGLVVELPKGTQIILHAGQSDLLNRIEMAFNGVFRVGGRGCVSEDALSTVTRQDGLKVKLLDGEEITLQVWQSDLWNKFTDVLRKVFKDGQVYASYVLSKYDAASDVKFVMQSMVNRLAYECRVIDHFKVDYSIAGEAVEPLLKGKPIRPFKLSTEEIKQACSGFGRELEALAQELAEQEERERSLPSADDLYEEGWADAEDPEVKEPKHPNDQAYMLGWNHH